MIQMQCFNNLIFSKVYTGGQNLTKTRRTRGLISSYSSIVHHKTLIQLQTYTKMILQVHATKMFMFRNVKETVKVVNLNKAT